MNLFECIKSSISQLLSNKMRTFLTMLGMFIGIGAVIMILSLGSGVRASLMDTFSDIGQGAVTISVKEWKRENLITQEDLEVLKEMPEIKQALLYDEGNYTSIKNYKEEDRYAVVAGVPYNLSEVQYTEIVAGRNFTRNEDLAKARVAVVSETYAKTIKGSDNPLSVIGTEIELNLGGILETFEIIGLQKAQTFPGMPEEMMPIVIYVPFSVVDQITGYGNMSSGQAALMVHEDYNPTEVAYQIGRLLDKRHSTKNGYTVQSIMQMTDQIDSILSMVTGFIGLVAGISLVVGGIGIMNIMLVTVKERTREIGIRKAIGATNREVLQQFLIEAVILTILGGIIGMFLGYFGGLGVGALIGIEASLTVDMIIFSVGTSSAIGIIFGVYPAKQAAKLDPVEALRYE
jgi:putative ABC transport system permease protein